MIMMQYFIPLAEWLEPLFFPPYQPSLILSYMWYVPLECDGPAFLVHRAQEAWFKSFQIADRLISFLYMSQFTELFLCSSVAISYLNREAT